MRIAEFASCTGISERMLRYHHQRGHLVPSEVDPTTGYRTYRDDQVADARALATLIATGTPAREAARQVAEHDTAAVLDRARSLLASSDTLREWAARPAPEGEGPAVRYRRLPARVVLAVDATCGRHEVVETVRAVRRRVARASGTSTARLPRGSGWSAAHAAADGSERVADGPVVRIRQPSYVGDRLTVTVQIPWIAQVSAVPRSMVRVREPEVVLAVVEVGDLRSVVLPDVVTAHRSLDRAPAGGAERWQLYDADLTRMWVAIGPVGGATGAEFAEAGAAGEQPSR